ncbi:GntG family PLP-dependent aldolase [Marivirga atlantica]|jgi:threonine aldolase|uniref:Aminotransferase class I/II-fold pyridoxal phosphate-dependent enzyme n=1 Tax=Marivirga atlantica TaxID=1548457 RepID=A0A937AHH9_9BACT|nr:GntG family PLP-dependent aldolase [Marivirga atlantica]MBL0766846.1 aminotransferase class I/II-fold pyridoxal phosphate-dependent enzyme [Marivirga atlantica]
MALIDLRSDTVTKPTLAMKEAMMEAQVGDDVFQEDSTVIALEQKTADYFGMEAGIFCPSGTMTNQIAIRLHTQPQSEVICDEKSHIYLYEGGGIAYNSLSSVRLLQGDRGRLNAEMIADQINNPDDIHAAVTSLVSLENTVNKGGGCFYDIKDIKAISSLCKTHNLPLHLDGARVFNALVSSGDNPKDYGQYFDTISICLSKGLGCPVGSVLLGSESTIKKARRIRKVLGGGMRQVGFLAAAGIYALDHHINRLVEDHIRARLLGEALQSQSFVEYVLPVDTNIVIFRLSDKQLATDFVAKLQKHGVLAVPFGKHDVRFVTHLDFNDAQLAQTLTVLKSAV